MSDPTFLGTVKGAVRETFVFVTLHSDYSGIKRTCFLSEQQLRDFFRVNGRPGLRDDEIETCIQEARKHRF